MEFPGYTGKRTHETRIICERIIIAEISIDMNIESAIDMNRECARFARSTIIVCAILLFTYCSMLLYLKTPPPIQLRKCFLLQLYFLV